MDHFLDVGGTSEYDVELCKECIEWARDEKRNFLRQALEVWPVSVAQFVTINEVFVHDTIIDTEVAWALLLSSKDLDKHPSIHKCSFMCKRPFRTNVPLCASTHIPLYTNIT